MSGIRSLYVWTLLIHAAPAVLRTTSAVQWLAHDEGDSVTLSCQCQVNQTKPRPIGVYLKRSWLRRDKEVLFKYEGSEAKLLDPEFRNRTIVSGDPSVCALNVTISGLRPSDTDLYHCEFNLESRPADTVQRGNTEFFLYVSGVLDVDRDLVDTCVGGSVVLPCDAPVGDSSTVEGVVLKRQRGQQPMELMYHSKQTSWSSQFSVDRFHLSTAPGPGGISYSLTVNGLQPEDSGLYSCQLLLHGRLYSPSMGRRGKYVCVQGDQCGCSSYSTLIYALSAAVAVTFILLVVVVLMHRGKRRGAKAVHTPAPIYEEMSGLQPKSPKRFRSHMEEVHSEYSNISQKTPRPENHYESPNGDLSPKSE